MRRRSVGETFGLRVRPAISHISDHGRQRRKIMLRSDYKDAIYDSMYGVRTAAIGRSHA